MKKTINHQRFFAHPPERVWEFLTTSELMAQWLMKNDFKPIVGHEFQFRTGPIPNLDFDGIFYCKVLEIIPFKKLIYSWSSGPGDGKITLESLVEWNLEPKENGTELILEHSGFTKIENLDFYKGFTHGWIEKFDNIARIINTVKHDNTNA